jgi:hypothetical protein
MFNQFEIIAERKYVVKTHQNLISKLQRKSTKISYQELQHLLIHKQEQTNKNVTFDIKMQSLA